MILNWLIVYSILFVAQFAKDIPACFALFRCAKKNKQNTTTPSEESYPPLSVIISAKDSAQALSRNLPHILKQDYPRFEVIVINDCSTDDTEDVLTRFEADYRHLYHTFVPPTSRYISHKKLALTMGIRASRHDWLVFTEADCCPTSNQWLKMLARNITENTEIILGYSNYLPASGWFNRKAGYDTLMHQVHLLGSAQLGFPYSASGRNMAYRKSLFMRHKGYSRHLRLLRGEDDLFINQYANGQNTAIEISPAAAVHQSLYNAAAWHEDAVMHVTTKRLYRKALLRSLISCGVTLSMYLFYILSVLFIAYGIYTHNWLLTAIAGSSLSINYGIKYYLLSKTTSLLGEQNRYRFLLPLLEWMRPLWHLRFRISWLFRNKSEFYRNKLG